MSHNSASPEGHSLVSFCGLFCGDCIIRKGEVWSLCAALLERLRSPEFLKLAAGLPQVSPVMKDLESYEPCCRMLATIVEHLHCTASCQEGGGSTNCRIRLCCQEKGLAGCWLCKRFETCETLAWLDPCTSMRT